MVAEGIRLTPLPWSILLLTACVSGVAVNRVPSYQTQQFVVNPGNYDALTLNMDVPSGAEGTIEGYFLVAGGNNDIGFRVRAPSGSYLTNMNRVSNRYNFHLTANESGPYTFFFDNGFSTVTSKLVTLVSRSYYR